VEVNVKFTIPEPSPFGESAVLPTISAAITRLAGVGKSPKEYVSFLQLLKLINIVAKISIDVFIYPFIIFVFLLG
jgi:hypothetical protein